MKIIDELGNDIFHNHAIISFLEIIQLVFISFLEMVRRALVVGFLVVHHSFFFVDFVDILDFVDFVVKHFFYLSWTLWTLWTSW